MAGWPANMVTKEEVMRALESVKDPEINASIVELGMVRNINLQGSMVQVDVAPTVPSCPMTGKIEEDVKKVVSAMAGVDSVEVHFSPMTEKERDRVMQTLKDRPIEEQKNVQKTWSSTQAGLQRLPKGKIGRLIAITSGKGGVGKSSVTGLLAVELRRQGFSVGILDADLTGSSIAKVFGVKNRPLYALAGFLIPPASRTGIKLMSVSLLMDRDDAALIWRGPLINNAIKQLYTDLEWGELDFLLADLPPGTSDAPLTVFQSLPLDAVLIVSSPQDLAATIVSKAINMAKIMNTPILGLIENMSYLTCPDCGKKIELFGSSRAEDLSAAAQIKLLGRIPVDPKISQLCDEGKIEEYENAEFATIAKRIVERTNQLPLSQELRASESK